MDIIVLRDLKVQTTIGDLAWERKILQTLKITLEIATDACQAAVHDTLSETLDYHAVAQSVISFGKENAYQLIETFAEKLAAYLIGYFGLFWIKVKVTKPKAISEAEDVSIIIERPAKSIDQPSAAD